MLITKQEHANLFPHDKNCWWCGHEIELPFVLFAWGEKRTARGDYLYTCVCPECAGVVGDTFKEDSERGTNERV